MTGIHLVTDSFSHIPEELCREYGIQVVPRVLVWDGQPYADNVDIRSDAFYARLFSSSSLPTTAGPSPGEFKAVFERLTADGDAVISIHGAHLFGSTLDTARQAREMLPDANITLVDSRASAMAVGFQVLAAARAARAGRSPEEVLSVVQQAIAGSGVVFTVQDMGPLLRSGRLVGAGESPALEAGLKPIVEVHGGPFEIVGKANTYREVRTRFFDVVEQRAAGGRPLRLAVLHADAPQRAQALLEAAVEHFAPDESLVQPATPGLAVHVGPGALGLCYCAGV